MTSRHPARDDFRSHKAVRRPWKDPRQTENPDCQADISCLTAHRRGFSFDDHGFRRKNDTYLVSHRDHGVHSGLEAPV
jgi:hypothetical protein